MRKDVRKLNTIWWIVLIGLAAPSIAYFRSSGSGKQQAIAKINGNPITIGDYQKVFDDLQRQRQWMKEKFGFAFETNVSPKEAFSRSVSENILNSVAGEIGIKVHHDILGERVTKMLSDDILDENGQINLTRYRSFLEYLKMTPKEFEDMASFNISRKIVNDAVEGSAIIPARRQSMVATKHMGLKKKFEIVKLDRENFEKRVEKEKGEIPKEELREYFDAHKEDYRLPERKQADFVLLSKEDFLKKVEVDDEAIERFYERNKSRLFKNPARFTVRRILIDKGAGYGEARERAQKAYGEVKAAPEKFAAIAKKYSDDKETKKKGGLLPEFVRGTHGENFEKAIVKLKEPGEIAPLFEDADGYDIVQLEKRVSATEKPLELVRNDVIEKLRDRKVSAEIKREATMLSKKVQKEPEALKAFADQNKVKIQTTKMMSEKDFAFPETADALISEIILGKKGRKRSSGFVTDKKDNFYIFSVSGTEESKIPPFNAVRHNIETSLMSTETRKAIKKEIKDIRREVIADGKNLKDIAEARGLEYKVSDFVKESEDMPGAFEEVKQTTSKAFNLVASNSVLKHKSGNDYFLIRLLEKQANEELKDLDADGQKELDSKIKEELLEEHESLKSALADSFIASLRRRAKIEILEPSLLQEKNKEAE